MSLIIISVFGLWAQPAHAEGAWQVGLSEGETHKQPLYPYNASDKSGALFVDILNAGEVINVMISSATTLQIYDPSGAQVVNQYLPANVSASENFNQAFPPSKAFQYTTQSTGTYEVRFVGGNLQSRFDISVTSSASDPVDPRVNSGRLWFRDLYFNTGSYAEAYSTDADLYAVASGGFTGSYFIWKLDLNNFAGFVYRLLANDLGVDSPNRANQVVAGLSVRTTNNSASAKYPIYFSYPAKTFPRPTTTPAVTDYHFLDDAGVDSSISPPPHTPGVQDTGDFYFTTNLTDDAVYELIVDTGSPANSSTPDGLYGEGDVFLRGIAKPGVNKVHWDGKNNKGQYVAIGSYTSRIVIRTGEFHFVAWDAESSGGNAPGLTIEQAISDLSSQPVKVYWDDKSVLGLNNANAFNQDGILGGHHSWGNFTGGGDGNQAFLDTYVYGEISATSQTSISVKDNNTPERDYGDAPESYGDAGHDVAASPTIFLGTQAPDREEHSQNAGAGKVDGVGDDNDINGDDEDGISTFPTFQSSQSSYTIPASAITVHNESGADATLYGFIDFNRDGDFNDAGEQVTQTIPNGATHPPADLLWSGYTVPTSGTSTYARFRISSDANLTAVGNAADGEVEDYNTVPVEVDYDYGDAPDDGTDFNYGVAKHIIPPNRQLSIGANKPQKDTDTDYQNWLQEWNTNGLHRGWFKHNRDRRTGRGNGHRKRNEPVDPAPTVTGDGAEEDGLSGNVPSWRTGATCSGLLPDGTSGTITMSDSRYCITVPASNDSAIAAQLVGWIDFNQNGVFDDPAERSVVDVDADTANDDTQGNVPAGTQNQNVVLYWDNVQKVAGELDTFIRLRLTSDPVFKSDHSPDPIGVAINGEVEDTNIGINTEGTDYGDAPSSYLDASHIIELDTYMGSIIDNDNTSQNAANGGSDGDGDDNDGYDDDDGVSSFPLLRTNLTTYSLDVVVTSPTATDANLVGWIDFDGSGTFDTDEAATVTVPKNTTETPVTLTWSTIPGDIKTGARYVRLRLTTDTSIATGNASTSVADGLASDGEVEDYPINIIDPPYDYGDAPSSYGDGRHILPATSGVYLGSSAPDEETQSQNTANGGADGNGDDATLTDDEDGVTVGGNDLQGQTLTSSTSYTFDADIHGSGVLNAWVDWNGDGDFADTGEYIIQEKGVSTGTDSTTLTIPGTVQKGTTYLRFRVCPAAGQCNDPASTTTDGEIEDYQINLTIGQPTSCIVGNTVTVGNAAVTNTGPGGSAEYQITPDDFNQAGALWGKEKVTLLAPFDLSMFIYAGDKDASGADGFAFLFHNDPRGTTTLGAPGEGIGYSGIQTGFAVEFDTWQNANDPANDHTAASLSGVGNSLLSTNPAQHVIPVKDLGNIEDNKYYLVRFVWDPTTQNFSYYFDGNLVASKTIDLVSQVGESALWGFTASTGGARNRHAACFQSIFPPITNDYGDAPDSYGDANHYIPQGDNPYLGTTPPDTESGLSLGVDNGLTASGDDSSGDDEDGISTLPELNDLATSYQATAIVNNPGGSPAHVMAWIDFDRNGNFETDEASALATVPAGSSNSPLTLNWANVPGDIKVGTSYMRVRITTDTIQTSDIEGLKLDGEVEDYALEIKVGGFPVKGRVYNDTNVDGINDANEQGISDLPVILLDVNNNSCISTRTDADGNYTFFPVIPGDYRLYEASRETVPVPQNCDVTKAKDPANYRSTTINALPQFSVVDQEITGKDFGDVKGPTFEPDHSGTILAGNVAYYSHKFVAKNTGSVSFSTSNSGGATALWSSTLYQDSDCNGKLEGAESNAPLSSNQATVAGQQICIINKVFAPTAVSLGETYTNVIQADFDFNANTIAGTTRLTVTDISKASISDPIAGNSKLTLRKTVENLTQGSAETETQNQAKPGGILKYRIYYSNTGTGVITELNIKDTVPAYTTLNGVPECIQPLPAGLSDCSATVSGDEIEWHFGNSDAMKGGGKGVVSYEVKVEP